MHLLYLPKACCWQGRPVEVDQKIHDQVVAFLAHTHLLAFSGYRPKDRGDHRCGMAVDSVPLTTDHLGYQQVVNAAEYAHHKGVAYIEPLSLTWTASNKHLHISWHRCH